VEISQINTVVVAICVPSSAKLNVLGPWHKPMKGIPSPKNKEESGILDKKNVGMISLIWMEFLDAVDY
jgi:hypothetical protein